MHLANEFPNWTFVAVDPSEKMLASAEERLGPDLMKRVILHHGFTEDLPSPCCDVVGSSNDDENDLFDGATCLLTFHHVEQTDRKKALQAVNLRLKPGAPLVLVHMSFPQNTAEEKLKWLHRYLAYAKITDPVKVAKTLEAVEEKLTILNPEEDEAMLLEAGFEKIQLFFMGFAFRGWVSYKK